MYIDGYESSVAKRGVGKGIRDRERVREVRRGREREGINKRHHQRTHISQLDVPSEVEKKSQLSDRVRVGAAEVEEVGHDRKN